MGRGSKALFPLFLFTADQEYVIEPSKEIKGNKEVVVMDVGTGVEQNSTQWTDLLHQFIQLKENLPLTLPTMISIYESNMSFIRSFGTETYGITGTLGSLSGRRLQQDLYSVNTFDLPRLKPSRLKQLKPTVVTTREKWKAKIIDAIDQAHKRGQAVHVLCETIADAQDLSSLIEKKGFSILETYTTNKIMESQKELLENVSSRTVIVATNIAGRGTDIKLDNNCKSKNGLHVIMTKRTDNLRIENQGGGRGGRKGEAGSYEVIVEDSEDRPLSMQKFWRDLEEACAFENIRIKEFPKNEFMQELYGKYLKFLTNLKDTNKEKLKEESFLKVWEAVLNEINARWGFIVHNLSGLFDDQDFASSITEKRSLLLNHADEKIEKLSHLAKGLFHLKGNRSYVENMKMLSEKMRYAHSYEERDLLNDAQIIFQQVSETNTHFAPLARYYEGLIHLKTDLEGEKNREESRKILKKALKGLEAFMEDLGRDEMIISQTSTAMNFSSLNDNPVSGNDSKPVQNLALQMQQKREVLGHVIGNICQLIGSPFDFDDLEKIGMERQEAETLLNTISDLIQIYRVTKKDEKLKKEKLVPFWPDLPDRMQNEILEFLKTRKKLPIQKSDLKNFIEKGNESSCKDNLWKKLRETGDISATEEYFVAAVSFSYDDEELKKWGLDADILKKYEQAICKDVLTFLNQEGGSRCRSKKQIIIYQIQ